jgi:hypothetical protein
VPAYLPPAETTWTATISKFALMATRRAGRSQQAETRCAAATRKWPGRPADVGLVPCVRDNIIPLRLNSSDRDNLPRAFDSVSAPVLLGVIKNESAQDHAMVWWTGSPLGEPATGLSWPGVEMEFVGVDEPGEYTGTIRMPLEAGGLPVMLSVRMTHHWPLVLLPIMLGVALSMWLRSYVRKRQGVLALRERRAQLVVRAERVDILFSRLDEEVPDAERFRLDAGIQDRMRQADRRIRSLIRSRGPAERDETERAAIDMELTLLEGTLSAWEELVEGLQRVGTLLAELDEASAALPEPDPSGQVPELRGTAEGVLALVPLGTDEAVHEHCNHVGEAVYLLERWVELAREAADLASQEGIADAAGALRLAVDLREMERVDRSLRGIRAAANLPRRFRLRSAAVASRDFSVTRAAKKGDAVVVPGRHAARSAPRVGKGPALWLKELVYGTPAERIARRAWLARSGSELAAGLLAFAVASVTALSELYTSKSYFGTLDDYVLAALWGFGTKLGLDAVRSALEGGVTWPFRRSAIGGGTPGGAG